MEDLWQQTYPGTENDPAEKTLRVCVIERGRVVFEQRLACNESLTVGRSALDTFTYSAWPLTTSLTLSEKVGKHYMLLLHPEVFTEVKFSGGESRARPTTLSNPVVEPGTVERVPMSGKSRVKVKVGPLSILFHCVDVLPDTPKPKLPAKMAKRMWGAGDKLFWAAALVSFMVEFGGMGYLYTIPRPEPVMAEILESRWAHYLKDPAPIASRPLEKKRPAVSPKATLPNPPEPRRTSAERPKDSRLSTLEREQVGKTVLAQMSMGGGGVLRQLQDLVAATKLDSQDDAFEGVTHSPHDGRSRRIRSRGDDIGELAAIGPTRPQEAKRLKRPTKTKKRRPKVKLRERGPDRLGVDGQVDEEAVARTIRSRLPLLQACYSKALKRDPNLSGRMELEIEIGAGGRVVDATIREDSIGSERVSSCVLRRVSSWRFGVQVEDSAFVTIPLIFQPGDS